MLWYGNPPINGVSQKYGEPLNGCHSAQGHVWAFMVVLVHPLGGINSHLFQVIPVVLRKPFVSHRSIEALYEGILLGLPRLNVAEFDAFPLSPCDQ